MGAHATKTRTERERVSHEPGPHTTVGDVSTPLLHVYEVVCRTLVGAYPAMQLTLQLPPVASGLAAWHAVKLVSAG